MTLPHRVGGLKFRKPSHDHRFRQSHPTGWALTPGTARIPPSSKSLKKCKNLPTAILLQYIPRNCFSGAGKECFHILKLHLHYHVLPQELLCREVADVEMG